MSLGIATIVFAAMLFGAVATPAAAQTTDSPIDSATAEVTETSIWGDGVTEMVVDYNASEGEPVTIDVPGEVTKTITSDGSGQETISLGSWFSGASLPLDVEVSSGEQTCAATVSSNEDSVNLCDVLSKSNASDVAFENAPTAEVSETALWGGAKEISMEGVAPENSFVQFATSSGETVQTMSTGGSTDAGLNVGNWFQGASLPMDVAARTDDQLCLGTLTESQQSTELDCATIQDNGSIGSGLGLGDVSMGDSFSAIGNLSDFDITGNAIYGLGFNAWAESGYFQIGSGASDGNEKRVIRAPDCPLGEPENTSQGCVYGEGVINGFDGSFVIPQRTIEYPTQTIYSEVLERNVNFQISIPTGLTGKIDLTSLNANLKGDLQVRILPSDTFGEECGFTVPFEMTTRTSGSADTNIGSSSGEALWLSVLRSGKLLSADMKQVTNEYSVPGASGCGTFNTAVNNELDLPSPQGENKAAFNWYLELDPFKGSV